MTNLALMARAPVILGLHHEVDSDIVQSEGKPFGVRFTHHLHELFCVK